MSHKLKIAIYSGVIPSSTFIERLIVGLGSTNTCEIYLFGALQNNTSYNSSVKVAGYKTTKWHKIIQLIRYSVLLFFFRRKEKKQLDTILRFNHNNTFFNKVKFYPVLWYKPDIFHLQWAKGLKDWIWVKEFGIKVILSLRGTQINHSPVVNEKLAEMYRNNFPKVNGFHAVSKDIALEAQKYAAPKDKIKVIYSGLDIKLKPESKPTRDVVFKIVSVGRPHWIKDYTTALDACKRLKDKGVKFQYTIIGALGNIEIAYQIKDLNLQDEVTLLGRKSFKTVKKSIERSHLLVSSSLKEGIANVVLEVMLLETLVLTTDCGGVNEVVQDGFNGFVVPIRNPEDMANQIHEIISLTDDDRDRITKNALETVRNQHNEDQMITEMVSLYQEL